MRSATVVASTKFAVALVAAPHRGLLAVWLRRRRQRRTFLQTMLAVHLFNHEGTDSEAEESRISGLDRHLRWTAARVEAVVSGALDSGIVARHADRLTLTDQGRSLARDTLALPG